MAFYSQHNRHKFIQREGGAPTARRALDRLLLRRQFGILRHDGGRHQDKGKR